MKKMMPNTSCNGNPVILGESSKIKMISIAVSKTTINFLRGDAIIAKSSMTKDSRIKNIVAPVCLFNTS